MPNGLSGLQPTLSNLIQFFSFISPFLLGFFLVLSSIFNQDIKGFIYLAGVLIATVINIFLLNIIRSEADPNRDPICDLIDFNIFSMGGSFNNPNLSASFLAFTFAYLILPMCYNKQMNWVVLIFLILFMITNAITKKINNCSSWGGILVGTLIGLILGTLWYSILAITDNQKLLYFNEFVSNNVICERPSKQTFRCSVYKNGELIKSNVV